MANLNKVQLIGRLTRDPELVSFQGGGRVAKIGFAVNNRVKNQQSGQWEDKAVWLDLKAFDREPGRKLATLCEQYLKKGHLAYIEGHLVLEEWDDKNTGEKRRKLVIVVEDLQFLEPRGDGSPRSTSGSRGAAPAASVRSSNYGDEEPDVSGGGSHADEDIPF
jgi:single-strand DNA-binding protein